MSAAQVRNRMRVTADKMAGTGEQATSFGSGMINPSAALAATVADETRAAGLAGLPQLTLPLGSIDGLPFGMSLLGWPNADLSLLEAAKVLLPADQ